MKYNDITAGNNEEFCWNTIDFPKPKKMQDIEMDWSGKSKKKDAPFMTPDASEGFVPKAGKEPVKDQTIHAQPSGQAQPNMQTTIPPQQPQAQPSPYMTNTQMGWTMPSNAWTMPAQQQVVVPQPYNVVPPQMPPMTPVVQPLYVTQPVPVIQPGIMPGQMTATYATMGMPSFQQPAQNTDVYKWLDKELDGRSAAPAPSKDQFFTFSQKNQDFQKLLDEEYARYKTKYDTNATSLNIQVAEALKKQSQQIEEEVAEEIKPATDRTVVYNAKAQHAFPQAPLDSTLFSKEPVTDFDKMIMEGTKDAALVGEATLAISNEQLKKEIDEVAQKVEAAYTNKPQLKSKSLEPKFDTKFNTVFSEEKEEPKYEPKFEVQDIVIDKPARRASAPVQIREYDQNKRQKDLESMAAARKAFFQPQENDLDKTSAVEIKSIFDQWDQEHKEEEAKKNKKKKKGGFGRFLLILLLLIALFVAADFAAITFFPEDQIGEFFFNVNDKAFDFYNLALGKIGKGEEKEPAPEVELTAQEKAVKEVNTNIVKIVCDKTSPKFSEQGQYGYNNLGSTAIVDDEQIINAVSKTLVQYNCAWIDYVNTGDDITCYDYLTADGEAFRSASSFEGIGKVTETFKKLNIGEIRKDSNNVYVFADELISVKNGNDITEVPQSLVYRMALVGDSYKIVDYSAYN